MTVLDLGMFESAYTCGDHPLGLERDEIISAIASAQWCCCAEPSGPPSDCGSCCDAAGVAIYGLERGGAAVLD